MADEKPLDPTKAAGLSKVEVTVEMGDDRNRNFHVSMVTDVQWRGRWDWANCRGKSEDGGSVALTVDSDDPIRGCPGIPGICITVSSSKRLIRVYDPLALEENKEAAERIARVIQQARGDKQGPMREMNYDNVDENDLKTWCYVLRRLVDGRQCRVLKGEVPTIEMLRRMPGKIILRGQFDAETDEPKMIDVPKRYRPVFEEVPGRPNEKEIIMMG